MVKQTDAVLNISRELPIGEAARMGILELAIFATEPGEMKIMLCTWQR